MGHLDHIIEHHRAFPARKTLATPPIANRATTPPSHRTAAQNMNTRRRQTSKGMDRIRQKQQRWAKWLTGDWGGGGGGGWWHCWAADNPAATVPEGKLMEGQAIDSPAPRPGARHVGRPHPSSNSRPSLVPESRNLRKVESLPVPCRAIPSACCSSHFTLS